jgi:hypothetical protein
MDANIPAPALQEAGASTPLPVALESDQGKLHLEATTALLQCSTQQAVQFTLGALVQTTTDEDKIDLFLGTPALLEKTLHYSWRQRLARLQAVGELLRLEQQQDSPLDVLNGLDDTIRVANNHSRGLFQMIVSKIIERDSSFTIDQLLPAKPLCLSAEASQAPNMMSSSSSSSSWHHWTMRWMQLQQTFAENERIIAMQVLVVLLYQRTSAHRQDLAVLLCALFPATHHGAAQSQWMLSANKQEWPRLAGMIGVECMGLWRVADEMEWFTSHPLLTGLFNQEQIVEREMEAIQNFLQNCLERIQSNGTVEVPEAMTALGFGILLKVAHLAILPTTEGANSGAYWQTFNDDGMRLCQKSNQCGSFEYFSIVMKCLVPAIASKSKSVDGNLPYEILRDMNTQIEKSTGEPTGEPDLSATCLIYASIGRELLSAVSVAFEGTLLSLSHDGACQNIGMLCNLAILVHRNSPVLCRRFWSDWEEIYTIQREGATAPICRLLDVAHELATKTSFGQTLQGLTPFLQMVSAVVHDASSTEMVLTQVVPKGMIRKAIVFCLSTNSANELRKPVLDVLYILARTGNTSACRTLLRELLEGDKAAADGGPRVLLTIAVNSGDSQICEAVLFILAELMADAPVWWVMESALHLMQHTKTLAPGNSSPKAFVLCIGTMIERMNHVLFSPSFRLEDKLVFLNLIETSIQTCASLLSGSLFAASSMAFRAVPMVYETVYHALKCITSLLVCIRPAMAIEGEEIRQRMAALRAMVISNLSRSDGLGVAALYYATLPVSMSLACELEEQLLESVVLEDVAANASKSLPAFLRRPIGDSCAGDSVQFLAARVANIHSVPLKVEDICAKGWLNDEDIAHVIKATQKALELVLWWGANVEDIVQSDDDEEMLSASPFKALSCIALLPPICRTHRDMSGTWSALGTPYLCLLLRYLDPCEHAILSTTTADVLFQCCVHASRQLRSNLGDDTMFRLLYQSPSFMATSAKLFTKLLPEAFQLEGDDSGDRICTSIALRLLRVVTICGEVSPVMALTLLGENPTRTFTAMCRVITDAINELRLPRTSGSSMLRKVQLACQCLEFVVHCWRWARPVEATALTACSNEMRSMVEKEKDFLTQLAAFLFDTAEYEAGRLEGSSIVIQSFVDGIIRLLTLELTWAKENTELDKNPRALESLIGSDFSRFISLTAYQTRLTSYTRFRKAYSEFMAQLSHTPASLLALSVSLFSPATHLGVDMFTEISGPDLRSAEIYFGCMMSDSCSLQNVIRSLDVLALTHSLCKGESRRLSSWGALCSSLVAVHQNMSSMAREGSTLAAIGSCCVRSCSQSLLEHLTNVEEAQMESAASAVVTEGLKIVEPLSALLLQCAGVTGREETTYGDLEEGFELIGACAKKLLSINITHLTLTTQLLGTATSMLSIPSDTDSSSDVYRRSMEAKLSLTALSCGMIERARPFVSPGDADQYFPCFRCCMTLLSTLMLSFSRPSILPEHEHYMTAALQILVDHDIVRSVVSQVSTAVSTEKRKFAVEHERNGLIQLILPTLDFFTTLASLDESEVLLLLSTSHVSTIMSQVSALVIEYDGVNGNLRGYTDIRQIESGPGADDPIHTLHRSSLRFLSTVLTSVSDNKGTNKEVRRHFVYLAIDFLVSNKGGVLRCLDQCGAQRSFCLTLNVAREAALILSICSELVLPDSVDYFRGTAPELFNYILDCSKHLLASLSSFLGASAAARERFSALEQDDSDFAEQAYQQTPVSLVYRVLKGGLPNTKHEGIRFAHFRYSHYNPVTADERSRNELFVGRWQPEEINSAPQSLSSLEHKCRSSVLSEFSFDLEREVADCLVYATRTLWRTHPASSSFVMYSTAEVAQLDMMSLVKKGTTIAFFPGRDRALTFGNDESSPSGGLASNLRYGQVIRADTYNRQWHVQFSGDGEDNNQAVVVCESELVGIEDAAKRQSVLAYHPAPETSSELEECLDVPSVGHLILVLRWCKNVFGASKSLPDSLVCRLSELVAAFIGTELAVHTANGSQLTLSKPDASIGLMAAQIFDLFGVQSSLSHVRQTSDRSMQPILSTAAWLAVRKQVNRELSDAEKNWTESLQKNPFRLAMT